MNPFGVTSMARTEEITICTFDDLSDAAKEKAREWYREASSDDQWWDSTYEDAKTIGALMGVTVDDIGFSGFWSQGDGAHFTGSFKYAKGCAKAVAQYAPQDTELQAIARAWQDLQARHFYQFNGQVRHSGHYQHAYCTSFDISRGDSWATEDQEDAVKEVMRDFMNWIYQQLEREYEWLNADEQVDGSILANEYEFTVDGSIH
jgi:hypothetical protein